MATPPRVTTEHAQEAVLAIHERHRRIDDPRLGEIGFEPVEVLHHLRKHGHRVPEGVRVDDLFDAATLHIYLWWQAADRERWLLDTADRLGIAHGEFGAVFGMRSRQGFRDRADRLQALLDATGPGRPDEKSGRADRSGASRGTLGEQEWLIAARDDVLQLAHDVAAFYPVVDDETAEELFEVRRDLKDGRYGPETFILLGHAVTALTECPLPEVAQHSGALKERMVLLQQQRAFAVQRA